MYDCSVAVAARGVVNGTMEGGRTVLLATGGRYQCSDITIPGASSGGFGLV